MMVLVDEGIRYHENDSLRIGKARRTINPPAALRAFRLNRGWRRMEIAGEEGGRGEGGMKRALLFDALSDGIV